MRTTKGQKITISENNDMREVLDNEINNNFVSITLFKPKEKVDDISSKFIKEIILSKKEIFIQLEKHLIYNFKLPSIIMIAVILG